MVAALLSLTAPLRAQLAGTDNFNDNSKDTSKWGGGCGQRWGHYGGEQHSARIPGGQP
jgi:Spy/CpxP family protein refolding chaperone